MRQRFLPVAALLAVTAVVSWRMWGPVYAPLFQPPLETLTTENFSGFEEAFDGAAGNVRIILLLSPT